MPDIVVDLAGVDASLAYEWGMEAGSFLHDVHYLDNGRAHEFHEGNLGMIELIAGENGYEIEVMGPAKENGMVRCVVRPWNKSRPPYLKMVE